MQYQRNSTGFSTVQREFSAPNMANAAYMESNAKESWAGIVDRRIEFAEKKMRQLEETVNQPTSERPITSSKGNIVHWVYGLARRRPSCLAHASDADCASLLARYQKSPSSFEMQQMPSRRWYLLYYPMEEVKLSPTNTQFFMRCKSVDKDTGHVLAPYEGVRTEGTSEERTFKRFSMYPTD